MLSYSLPLFAVTSLPVLTWARGSNSGVDRSNAYSTELYQGGDGILTLHTWNHYDRDTEINEIRGDLEIEAYGLESPSSGADYVTMYLQFGFCM